MASRVVNSRWNMNRKGFTLVELLAVIVVIAILATVATPNVIGILKKQKGNTTEIVINNLKDATTGYAKEQISLGKLHLSSCDFMINDEQTANNNMNKGSRCVKSYTISSLKTNGIFEDKKNSCNVNRSVYVYKYNNGSYDEIMTYVPSDVCEVK